MAIQKSKVALWCAVLMLSASAACASKLKPEKDPCEKVPLEDEIRGAEMVAAVTFIDFTDDSKKVGRFKVRHVWKGDVKIGDEINIGITFNFTVYAKAERDRIVYVFFVKKQGDVFFKTSCRRWYRWREVSFISPRGIEFNNAVIRSMRDGDSKK